MELPFWLGRARGGRGQYPARGDGIFVNVVHQTDGFAGQIIPAFWFLTSRATRQSPSPSRNSSALDEVALPRLLHTLSAREQSRYQLASDVSVGFGSSRI